MRVVIWEDVYADHDQWLFLDLIVNKIADGWHSWQINDPEIVENSGWLAGPGRNWLRELFQKAALAAAYPEPHNFHRKKVLVSLANNQTDALPPEKAAEYVSTPLTILMENRFTDGEIFLNIVLGFLGSEALNKQRNNAPDSIRYDSPGGNGELPKLIHDYVRRAEQKGIPVRAVVFADSDATVPGKIEQDAKLVQDACNNDGLPCKILIKRTIENYIPDEILDKSLLIVKALKKLSPEQRDHYPMKKGLKLEKASAEVKALYQGISDEDLNALSEGFGKNVIKKLLSYQELLAEETGTLRGHPGQRRHGQDGPGRGVGAVAGAVGPFRAGRLCERGIAKRAECQWGAG